MAAQWKLVSPATGSEVLKKAKWQVCPPLNNGNAGLIVSIIVSSGYGTTRMCQIEIAHYSLRCIVQSRLSELAGTRRKHSDNRDCLLIYAYTHRPRQSVWITEVWIMEVSLYCGVCRRFEDRIRGMYNISLAWLTGTTSHWTSNVLDHVKSEQHITFMGHLQEERAKSQDTPTMKFISNVCIIYTSCGQYGTHSIDYVFI